MKLIRFLENPNVYGKVYIGRDEGKPAPIAVLRGLMPTNKELDHISLYEIEDDEDPLFILAAFSLITKGNYAIVCVDRADVESLGIELKKTSANTDNAVVNDRHYDAFLNDGKQAWAIAELFYSGKYLAYEQGDVRDQLAKDSLSGELDIYGAAKKADANRPAKICELIGKRSLILAQP